MGERVGDTMGLDGSTQPFRLWGKINPKRSGKSTGLSWSQEMKEQKDSPGEKTGIPFNSRLTAGGDAE